MKLFGKLMMAAMFLWLMALATGCAEKPDQPGDTGQNDKSRNELLR
jgi:hypothetical protein